MMTVDDKAMIMRLQKRVTDLMADKKMLERQVQNLQGKAAKQRNELARVTQKMERLAADKAKLLDDIKFLRGE
jgi:peptidoglycan hydrolase CwlO-like protein